MLGVQVESFPNLDAIMEFIDLWSCIYMIKLFSCVKGVRKWVRHPSGSFVKKDMYCSVVEDGDFPWLKIWWKVIPSKVSSFAWKAVRDIIPSKDNLLKFSLSSLVVVGAALRPVCSSVVESSMHLPVSCPSSLLVWEADAK